MWLGQGGEGGGVPLLLSVVWMCDGEFVVFGKEHIAGTTTKLYHRICCMYILQCPWIYLTIGELFLKGIKKIILPYLLLFSQGSLITNGSESMTAG